MSHESFWILPTVADQRLGHPGAVAGVVSITTHNGLTFQGTDVTVTQGAVEQFTELFWSRIQRWRESDDGRVGAQPPAPSA